MQYFERNWFINLWRDSWTDIGLPRGHNRDSISTNNWTERAFKTFDQIFLENRANKSAYRLVMIIANEWFAYYENWQMDSPKVDRQAVERVLAHHISYNVLKTLVHTERPSSIFRTFSASHPRHPRRPRAQTVPQPSTHVRVSAGVRSMQEGTGRGECIGHTTTSPFVPSAESNETTPLVRSPAITHTQSTSPAADNDHDALASLVAPRARQVPVRSDLAAFRARGCRPTRRGGGRTRCLCGDDRREAQDKAELRRLRVQRAFMPVTRVRAVRRRAITTLTPRLSERGACSICRSPACAHGLGAAQAQRDLETDNAARALQDSIIGHLTIRVHTKPPSSTFHVSYTETARRGTGQQRVLLQSLRADEPHFGGALGICECTVRGLEQRNHAVPMSATWATRHD
ncbi:hypothetical protein B0H15DRAFT_957677 [Mycena belliarum]|uniref:Uncharacterized protein n=1 Tax=Mycena belliarum TaxID=1033014 RepID=A0AAD6TS74_9AGAR|nr:hypothetical protein B0H15DRAFT_957677 [Mycena belliae]